MSEYTDKITDWKSYKEQKSSGVNSPERDEKVNGDGTTDDPYYSLGNAFRAVKKVIREESKFLGWNPANTFINTASGNTWELADNNTDADNFSKGPLKRIKINSINLCNAAANKDRLITRGMKVMIESVISGTTYYWKGYVESVSFSTHTYLVCSNVNEIFAAQAATDVSGTDGVTSVVHANRSVDYAPSSGDPTSSYDYTTSDNTKYRGGFSDKGDRSTANSLWDAAGVGATTSATLYISAYREKAVPHDPDQQGYLDSADPTWANITNAEKMGLANEASPYPNKSQQGCFFVSGAGQRFAVVLPRREPNNRYSLFFTPLENFKILPTASDPIDASDLTNTIAYEDTTKDAYTIVKVTKETSYFVVEFKDGLPPNSAAAASGSPDAASGANILWEWKLVRDFRS